MQTDPEMWPKGESRTVINLDGWTACIEARGIQSEKALAQALRISEPALWRVRKGHSEPGTKFIRHAIRALQADYSQLFRHEDAA